ncbi:unnamed protein product [Cylicocyclus nassatus]|uniref:C3H1-type domain-containing protein n=1 Tax=Cylicocyclus nassatus TaxID=53992 RepID=A0AA36GMD5_CYLNA|nr:unnamed protein product [Cylicocyclus nassatus]
MMIYLPTSRRYLWSLRKEQDTTLEVFNEREYDRAFRQRRPAPPASNYKTKMCMTYASGRQCEMGSRCKFAHGPEELRVAETQPQRQLNSRYKTKLCKNFGPYSSNYCPYGLRCEFIHPTDKEYALLCSRQGRNPAANGNGPQHVGDVTPETVSEAPPAVTRSAAKPAVEEILLKNRNIAGSMVCLATAGRREQAYDDSAIGSGSSDCGASLAHAKALAKSVNILARDSGNVPVPIKFLRRRSMSQFTLKRFNSSEHLDIAASCSQLAAIEHRTPISMFSPLK